MKIVFFTSGLSGGGAERVCCNLANFLCQREHDIEFITISDDEATYPLSTKISRQALLHQQERSNFLHDNLLRFYRVCKLIRKTRCDCYIVMLPIPTILLLSLRFLTKAKIIASERVDPSTYPPSKQKRLKKVAHKADGWVFQTEIQKNWYGNSIGSAAVKIIPNAINKEFITAEYSGPRNKQIVSSGRLTEQKNHALLIKAFAGITAKYPAYKLVIYGDGPLRKDLELLASNLGIADKVSFPGYTTEIRKKIERSSLFVLSSDFEGMPNALMEAMALGVPCISTDCKGGGARFLIKNGTNGLLTPIGDVEALQTAMEKILSDQFFADNLSHNAHKLGETHSPEKIYAEWENLIKKVVCLQPSDKK